MAIRARWKGNPENPTEHHYGIPARDLEQEEYDALDNEQRKTVRESPLYDYRPDRAADTPARAEGGKG